MVDNPRRHLSNTLAATSQVSPRGPSQLRKEPTSRTHCLVGRVQRTLTAENLSPLFRS